MTKPSLEIIEVIPNEVNQYKNQTEALAFLFEKARPVTDKLRNEEQELVRSCLSTWVKDAWRMER